MNILIGIIFFVIGFILGVFTRNILIKVISIRKKIKQAEEIIAKRNKELEFKAKYDFFDEEEIDEQKSRKD